MSSASGGPAAKRQEVALAEPPESLQVLEGFPRVSLAGGSSWVRVTRRGRGPWWFASGGTGRFDLPSPRGTCYLSDGVAGAMLEVLGGVPPLVGSEWLAGREVHELRLPTRVELANLASRSSRAFGITGEIHTLVPYDLPQRWARAFDEARFDGLRYRLRHDPSGKAEGVAVFGPEGERQDWPLGRSESCNSPEMRQILEREAGILVADRPRLDQLVVED